MLWDLMAGFGASEVKGWVATTDVAMASILEFRSSASTQD